LRPFQRQNGWGWDLGIAAQLKIGIIAPAPPEPTQETMMLKWMKPKVREIVLGAEINCYASAELTA